MNHSYISPQPFWNKTIRDVSSKLWLPLETTSMASPLNCSHGSFDTINSHAWFTIQKWKPIEYKKPMQCMQSMQSMQSIQKEGITITHSRLFKYAKQSQFLDYKEKTNLIVNVRKQKYEWVALDPGSNTFQTLYSPTQDVAYKFGHNDMFQLFEINNRIEELETQFDDAAKTEQWALKRQLNTMVNMAHIYVVHFLCNNFNNIIIPPFVVENVWRHGDFLQLLLCEAQNYNVNVYVRSEEYTTKTCTHCGKLNDVGNKKTFECKHCFIKIDRDLSGSRNIFLKNMFTKG